MANRSHFTGPAPLIRTRRIRPRHGRGQRTPVLLPVHISLALLTGMLAGAITARVVPWIPPAYAAIVGALALYPVALALWSRR